MSAASTQKTSYFTANSALPPKESGTAIRDSIAARKESAISRKETLTPKESIALRASIAPKESAALRASIAPKVSIIPKASVIPRESDGRLVAAASQRLSQIRESDIHRASFDTIDDEDDYVSVADVMLV